MVLAKARPPLEVMIWLLGILITNLGGYLRDIFSTKILQLRIASQRIPKLSPLA
jgi:hypothetical protein